MTHVVKKGKACAIRRHEAKKKLYRVIASPKLQTDGMTQKTPLHNERIQ
jgi:hypothetical protein